MFVFFLHLLYLAPCIVVYDFRIDIFIDSIAVNGFSVITGICHHFIDRLFFQIAAVFCADSTTFKLVCDILYSIALRI